jgi:hypothetical protein
MVCIMPGGLRFSIPSTVYALAAKEIEPPVENVQCLCFSKKSFPGQSPNLQNQPITKEKQLFCLMTDSQIFSHIASTLSLSPKQIQTVAGFIDEGATIPFLARYRQEATGGLDEEQLRSVRDLLEFHRTLEARKKTILKAIKEQDKLTPELEEKIVELQRSENPRRPLPSLQEKEENPGRYGQRERARTAG